MALTDYDALKAAIARNLRRSDLTADIPDFITVAEGRMNRRLRVRRMVARATASLSDEYSAVPEGFLGIRTFSVDGSPSRMLKWVSPDRMDELAGCTVTSGIPEVFTVVGGEFRYWPSPSPAVTGRLTYWQAIPPLSDSNDSNWVLELHPDAYLYGALAAAAPFLKSDERLATWAALFQSAIDEIVASDRTESFGAAIAPVPSGHVV